MVTPLASRLPQLLAESHKPILADWLKVLRATPDVRLPAAELEAQCDIIIARLAQGCRDGNVTNVEAPGYAALRDVLARGFALRKSLTRDLDLPDAGMIDSLAEGEHHDCGRPPWISSSP
ncbi:RsbRD N-terminal domain-containing protein, partial [Rhodopila globiformis]